MIEIIAKKLTSGDIYVVKSKSHLEKHEWGLAYLSILAALEKGNLSEADAAQHLYREICTRLDLSPTLNA